MSLGDLVLDVVVRAEREVARDADTPARISVSAGGQGANVAAWVAELGGVARWLGKRGSDPAGRLAAELLADRGVELCGPVEAERNGIVVSLAQRDGARSMFPDRGVAVRLRPDELRPEWLECDHLHVSGYALLAQPVASAAVRAVELARERVPASASTSRRGARSRLPERRAFRELVASLSARRRLRQRGRGTDLRRPAAGRCLDPEARRGRVLLRR